jgi:hypothetical protein
VPGLQGLIAWARGDVSERDLGSLRSRGSDAYDLVDTLPRGESRAAAWVAYAFQTYGDKLVSATRAQGYVRSDTAQMAARSFELAALGLEVARGERPGAAIPGGFPRWGTPVRSEEQLAGMRDALESLRTYVAFDLGSVASAELAAIDDDLAYVQRLWMPRPPVEICGGIADALGRGLDRAYALGRALASG